MDSAEARALRRRAVQPSFMWRGSMVPLAARPGHLHAAGQAGRDATAQHMARHVKYSDSQPASEASGDK